jgi:hypothetical protein
VPLQKLLLTVGYTLRLSKIPWTPLLSLHRMRLLNQGMIEYDLNLDSIFIKRKENEYKWKVNISIKNISIINIRISFPFPGDPSSGGTRILFTSAGWGLQKGKVYLLYVLRHLPTCISSISLIICVGRKGAQGLIVRP